MTIGGISVNTILLVVGLVWGGHRVWTNAKRQRPSNWIARQHRGMAAGRLAQPVRPTPAQAGASLPDHEDWSLSLPSRGMSRPGGDSILDQSGSSAAP
jgi:hypothetical protein